MSNFRDMLHRAVDGSFAIDANQRIIYWDSGCEELLGYTAHWALGRPCPGVLNGCYPSSGKPFCTDNCCVSRLGTDNSGPKIFPLKVKDKDGRSQNLSVSIVLVPSTCKNGWHVMHLLHKNLSPDVLNAIDNSSQFSTANSYHRINKSKVDATEYAKSRLTPRESEILSFLAEGNSGAVIAERLCISNTTVRNHIQHIQGKLGVHSRAAAIAYSYRHNFL